MSNARLFYAIPGCERLTVTYRPRTDGTRREQVREQVALAQWLGEFVEEWRQIERTMSDDTNQRATGRMATAGGCARGKHERGRQWKP